MQVYLDNAATTPIAPEVVETMHSVLLNEFGNPSSIHSLGRKSKVIIENARRTISTLLNCSPAEIFFTSGGTEADNIVFHTAIQLHGVKHIITSPLEHHAVGHTVEFISKIYPDVQVSYVRVDQKGHVDLAHLEELLVSLDTKTLISLMHANNEISTLLCLENVSKLAQSHDALFHSDTVQTMGHYSFNLQELPIDFITCSAHKFHGPKGVGFLYARGKSGITSVIQGGGQERGFRGGTENLYGIAGLAKAMELAYNDLEKHTTHIRELKSYFQSQLQEKIPGVSFIGENESDKSLYTVLNVSFPEVLKDKMLLFTLDLKGICASGGSACSAGASTGSHVLDGIQYDAARPNIRFSFSRFNTKEEIDYTIQELVCIFEGD